MPYKNPATLRAVAWNRANRARRLEIQKKYRVAHSEAANEASRKWALENRERKLETSRNYSNKWRLENPEQAAEKLRKFNKSQEGKAWRHSYRAKRRAENPAMLLKDRLRNRVYSVLRGATATKSACTFELTGCTIEFLKEHLEKQFRQGMSWANRNLWHVDHIVPCAAFDLTDPKQQKACFHYTNLQPLWATENLRKGSRYGQTSCSPT